MKALLLTLIIVISQLTASQNLVFGAISTVEPKLMKAKLTPLIKEIEKVTGANIEFQTGYDYTDTISKFADGSFDIGLIGPAPYIRVKNIDPNALKIIASIKNSEKSPFRSVIISKKGSKFLKHSDLKDQNFAFGSPESTLSYYVPKSMLIDSKTLKELRYYDLLGRHDRVAQYVIMGKYSAGAVKQSVANKYSKYLQVIATSEAMPGFMIVANSKLDKNLVLKIKKMLLNLEDIKIIQNIKKSAVGFQEREDSDYDKLRDIMDSVDNYK
ncbi:MAG: phosphate/phosphite/phosphonate ABC transporter substrate-binding protein [Campylobacterota bacterium]|nr:phosphate/phosphite/phosphonate ABC transporter substrate-binding protein [Campylobacterota bacterium]